jgi:hypothetical protein
MKGTMVFVVIAKYEAISGSVSEVVRLPRFARNDGDL